MKRHVLAVFALATLVAFVPVEVRAQDSGDGFLFRTPRVQLGIRAGYAGAAAQSQIFEDSRTFFTLDRNDFAGGLFGAEVAFRVTERLDVALAFSTTTSKAISEYRDWEGDDGLPIRQETKFTRRPFTATMRYFLGDRGRSVSRFAWVPHRFAPYVGAGGGVMWYEFVQEGEFVDFVDLAIFDHRYTSDGTAMTGHLIAGLETSLSPRIVLDLQGRYEWAEHDMGVEWQDFDPIDLSGFQVSVGLAVRF